MQLIKKIMTNIICLSFMVVIGLFFTACRSPLVIKSPSSDVSFSFIISGRANNLTQTNKSGSRLILPTATTLMVSFVPLDKNLPIPEDQTQTILANTNQASFEFTDIALGNYNLSAEALNENNQVVFNQSAEIQVFSGNQSKTFCLIPVSIDSAGFTKLETASTTTWSLDKLCSKTFLIPQESAGTPYHYYLASREGSSFLVFGQNPDGSAINTNPLQRGVSGVHTGTGPAFVTIYNTGDSDEFDLDFKKTGVTDLSFNFSFQSQAITFNASSTSVSAGDTLILSTENPLLNSLSSWVWKLDGVLDTNQTTAAYTWISKEADIGSHILSASVNYEGITYSGNVIVNITTPANLAGYMLAYDRAGADSGLAPVDVNRYSSSAKAIVKSSGTLVKNQSRFVGWQTSLDGTGTFYLEGEEIQLYVNTVLYPVWSSDMVLVPTGKFQRDVNLLNISAVSAFYMSRCEVTQAEYMKVMGRLKNPSNFTSGSGATNRPVEKVSWYDALVFCNTLSMQENLEPVYTINNSTNPVDWGSIPTSVNSVWENVICNTNASGYRLPTEMEWMWAAMGANQGLGTFSNSVFLDGYKKEFPGDANPLSNGDDPAPYAWTGENSSNTTHTTGLLFPNEMGFFDLGGNVSEWIGDSFISNIPTGFLQDYSHRLETESSMKCGGSWDLTANPNTYILNRTTDSSSNRIQTRGIRLVRKALTSQYVPRSGLVGEWLLDASLTDTSGLAHNGTATSQTPPSASPSFAGVKGRLNSCYYFPQSGTINLGDFPVFKYAPTEAFTFSVWFNSSMSTGADDWPTLIGQASTADYFGYALGLNNNEVVASVGQNNNSANVSYLRAAYNTTDAKWHHVVITFYNGSIKLYFDGNLASSAILTSGAQNTLKTPSPNNLTLGGGGTNQFIGYLDNIRVYKRALNQSEVMELFNE